MNVLFILVLLCAAMSDFGDRIYKSDGKQYIRCLYNENVSISVTDKDLENAGKHKWRSIKLANGNMVDITIQPGVNNCGTISFVNTLLALGEPKDSVVITEALAQPYAVPDGTIFNKYYKDKYKKSIKYFSNHNFDHKVLANKDGVFQEMMKGWQAGKAYEIGIGTYALPTDMKKYEGGNFVVYYNPECKGYSETFNTSPHAVFVVGFTTNSKGENVIILDEHGTDVYITEASFQYELGKVILSVQCIERQTNKKIVKVNTNTDTSNLPLYEAQYTQSLELEEIGGYVSSGNCANVAYANCCASLIGKQDWIDKISTEHYRFDKEGENPIMGNACSGSEQEFKDAGLKYEGHWHEDPNLYVQAELSTFDPKEVWKEMVEGMRANKRYILSTGYNTKGIIGVKPDGSEYQWKAYNHAIYVEGFKLDKRGQTVMQLDRYGYDFWLTQDQWVSAFELFDDITTIMKED